MSGTNNKPQQTIETVANASAASVVRVNKYRTLINSEDDVVQMMTVLEDDVDQLTDLIANKEFHDAAALGEEILEKVHACQAYIHEKENSDHG
jgi:hypothetical protein